MGESDRQIGRRIAELRDRRGWSQRALARTVGLDQAVLSRVESGKRQARASELEKLASALGVEIGALVPSPLAAPSADLAAPSRGAAALSAGVSGAVEREDYTPTAEPWSDLEDSQRREQRSRAWSPETPEMRSVRPARLADVERPASSRGLTSMYYAFAEPGAPDQTVVSPLPAGPTPPAVPTLPAPADTVIADHLRLRALRAGAPQARSRAWRSVDSLGRRRPAGKPAGRAAAIDWHEPRDRYARLWRHELDIGGEGPVPDLVAVFEDSGLAEVVVARCGRSAPVAAAG